MKQNRDLVTWMTYDRLKAGGSSDDLLKFTESIVAQYNERDMRREWRNGFWVGTGLAVIIYVLFALVPVP